MLLSLSKLLILAAFLYAGTAVVAGQTDPAPFPTSPDNRIRENPPRTLNELLRRRRAVQMKKQHEEMLKRGEDAVKLASELENAVESKEIFSASDRKKLDDLEKLIVRIRRDLGGGSDGIKFEDDEEIDKPSSFKEAVTTLRETTDKLLDELKRTSRYSISAVAIQTSNTAIRIAKFLKLRK